MHTAKRIMTTEVKTVPAEMPLREVARFLAEHGISGAPVVNDAGEPVGVISESDLLDGSKRNAAIPRFAPFGLVALPDELFQQVYDDGWKLCAADVMTRPAITADEETPSEELADRMGRHRINRIPIVRGNKVVGIITRADLLRALAAGA
jgi:CBS domain-containing protein